MEHSDAIQYWDEMARNNPNEKTIKVNPQNDYTHIDANFIMEYANENSEILDLACGTGLTINKYYEKVGHIDAVEKFSEFTKFIIDSPNVSVYNEAIENFEPNKDYDQILMFGIVQYFNESEIKDLYAKYKEHLKPSGELIVKNQFGVHEDVTVSGISEELNLPYYSEYRHIDREVSIIRSIGLTAINTFDIYPPEANRWDNTHFYAIVATEDTERDLGNETRES